MAEESIDSVPSMVGVYALVYCLLEGLQRVSGVFFLAAVEILGMSRMSASVPFLVSRTTANWTGILLEHLHGHRSSPRRWISWGCFLSAAGVALCFLTKEPLWLSVFWGIIFGAGIGIAIPLIITELTNERKETIMSSLLPASPSFGCIVLPFLIQICISNYGLNGCYLIIAGSILNSIPFICVAKYRIKFRLPKAKWHLRKRSKRYQMSQKVEKTSNVASYKPKGLQEFYNESFLENLEPDALQKVSDAEDCSATNYGFADIFQPIIDANRIMTEVEKKSIEIEPDQKNDKHKQDNFAEKVSEIVADVQLYENNRKIFEGSFTQKDIVSQSTESCSSSGTPLCLNGSDSGNSSVESIKVADWKEVEQNENNVNSNQGSPPIISSTDRTFHVQKGMSSQVHQAKINYPLEIKVHVVECTITTNAEFLGQPLEHHVSSTRRKGARRHSNSLISGCYDNLDFTQLLLNNKASPLLKQQVNHASRMFLITEEDENEFDKRLSVCCSSDVEAPKKKDVYTPDFANNAIQKFRRLLKPSCLVIIYTFVTYELTLAVLLTMFADFARDIGDSSTSPNLVLVAFGLGGLIGQMSFTYWAGRFLADGSYAAAAIIFMLNGLAVAGILWSAGICWMSGFYAVFGFVESGILLVLPRLVADFIEEENVDMLSSTCKCLSGVVILCMPFAMGLSRDTAGDYDGLLQVTSCLSVLCALLCYFLPRFTQKHEAIVG